MFKDLSPNLKISITRSISQSFEQYMSSIEWDEDRFSMEGFISEWREYITTKALWYSTIPDDIKADPQFHQDLADKINEVVAKILSEPPSESQIASIQAMQEELDEYYQYECKAEAAYVEQRLKEKLQSK